MTTCWHPEKRLAFIHIPKCAGSTVGGHFNTGTGVWDRCWLNDVLPGWTRQGFPNGHQPVQALEFFTGKPIDWFHRVIVTIRNPFAQQFSQYCFWVQRAAQNAARNRGYHVDDRFASSVTFRQFVADPRSNGPNAVCGDKWRLAGGVYRWWCQKDGQIPPNVRVVRTEDLRNGLESALEGLGGRFKPIPRINEHPHPKWETAYTPESVASVREKFAWAFALHYPELTSFQGSAIQNEPSGGANASVKLAS